MSKLSDWYEDLPPNHKEYLKNQPIWKDKDLYKFAAGAAIIGFIIGFLVGYEVAWEPVITTFKPLIG